jgi:hypothetical protein
VLESCSPAKRDVVFIGGSDISLSLTPLSSLHLFTPSDLLRYFLSIHFWSNPMAKSKNKLSIVNQHTAGIDIGSRKIFIGLQQNL